MQIKAGISQVAVVAPEHPLAKLGASRAVGIPDLADHLQIVLSDPTNLSQGQDFGVLSPQTCRVSSQSAKHALIVAGVGWGRLPFWQVHEDLNRGRLVRLSTKSLGRDAQVNAESYLARRLDEPFGPAARRLGEALTRICANDPA